MGERVLRIVLKPYSIKGNDSARDTAGSYWRAATDWPASKSGKPIFGTGIDMQTALNALKQYIPGRFAWCLNNLTEANAFPCPDHMGWYQVNLDGSKLTKEQWAYEKNYYDRFGHLPSY